ncbi:hypothetical protein PR202_ga18600 [Eleusine coracana subsp. coracana]|uniref:AMP-binding enzyme C-terminal domain-containing protein n=1 Tax=Eleusine coracana subsp. coracana TaxID=191504 RepID=A0AAV5CTF5_ELECO|nr:hypothetical protein PR202_ga18600 [Eleusine coracana subsp. coracana]
MYEMHFGVPMSGAVLNNINTRLDARTVAVLLKHSGSKLVFVDPASLQLLHDALRLLPADHPAPRVIPMEDPYEKQFPPADPSTLTSKDIIISGGENISSVEVESVICSHPAVSEVAVVAQPDEFWGETPCAFVVLKKDEARAVPTGEDVIAWCRARMPHYMVPKTVVFRADLPRTSTGKVQKDVLRDIAKEMERTGKKNSSKM